MQTVIWLPCTRFLFLPALGLLAPVIRAQTHRIDEYE